MTLSKSPELLAFFSTYVANGDQEADATAAESFAAASPERAAQAAAQARRLLESGELPLDELGSEANRWFGDSDEAAHGCARSPRSSTPPRAAAWSS